MRTLKLFLFLLFAGTCAFAQDYSVPGRLNIAGIDLRINDAARKSIQADVDALTQSPKYWEIKAERARTYFPIIERIFREEGIPEDIKYLVLQESALIADAVSTSNAVGYWQMKDFTAVELGLRVDRLVDERKNIVASSYGAAAYLNRSNALFDNWLNSLQSYQMGIAGAEKALGLKDQGAKTMHITDKTYWYVKKYIAHYIAYNNVLDKPAQKPVSEYSQAAGKSLNEIARETKTSSDEIRELNIWLKHSRVPDDKAYTVLLPGTVEITETVLAENSGETTKAPVLMDMSSEYPRIKETRYKDHKYIIGVNGLPGIIASESDDVESLAAKGEISTNRFMNFNDLTGKDIIPGQVYYFKRKKRRAGTHYHTLQPGETAWYVSQKYGIRMKMLLQKNRIEIKTAELKPGRVLWLRFIRPGDIPVAYSEITVDPAEENYTIPIQEEDPEEVTATLDTIETGSDAAWNFDAIEDTEEEILPEEPVFDPSQYLKKIHSVEQGQTYYSISKIYGNSVLDLLDWNGISIHDKLSIGQKLIVYIPRATQGSPDSYHEVKPGETLYSISRIYSVSVQELLEWNNKSETSLTVGEKIRVREPN